MSDVINDALDALNRLKAEKSNPAAVSVLESVVKTALSANGGEAVVAKNAPHSDYGYIPSKDHQWFFYDPEGDEMVFCKTEEEAFSGADQAIMQSLDECWSECVDQICYGKIVQAASQVDRVNRPENVGDDGYTSDGVHWPQDCEFMCNYRLEPVAHPAPPSVAVPEGWHDDAQVAIRNAQSDVFRGSREEYYETMMLLFARRILSLTTHPAESREEIQAQALDEAAALLLELSDNADENGHPDHGEGMADAAQELLQMSARLRASQQEGNTAGDDGEAVGNGSPDIIDRLDNCTGAGDY